MRKMIFATGNENKMVEIREILGDLPLEIQSMKEAGVYADVVEDGSTFEENALIKAEKVRAEEDRKKYERLYSKVLSERDLLKKSIGMATDASVRKMMQGRFSVLEKYVAAHLSGNMGHEAGEELEKLLSDRESFLQSTRLSFAFSHPGFLSYLKGRGLTEEEIGICCLYGMGLHGKEIGTYLGRKGYYNYSSSIRRKLGLDSHGQHIDGYLRDILQKTDSGI